MLTVFIAYLVYMQEARESITLDGEQFRLIEGTSIYYVSRSGRVYQSAKCRFMKPYTQPLGYVSARVSYVGEGSKNPLLHRLVAGAFIENPENKPTVNHIDGNKANNCAANLEWATSKEQTQHALANGLMRYNRGAAHHNHGKQIADGVKAKMSEAKQGERHPRFKGYYHTPYGVFTSARAAEKVVPNLTHVSIGRFCKDDLPQHSDWSFIPAQAA